MSYSITASSSLFSPSVVTSTLILLIRGSYASKTDLISTDNDISENVVSSSNKRSVILEPKSKSQNF